MAILVPEPKGPVRTRVSVPLTAPIPSGTLFACTWKLQVVKVMGFPVPDSGPCVKEKVQEPKVVLPLDGVSPLVTLAVAGVVKVSVAGLLPMLGSKIEPG